MPEPSQQIVYGRNFSSFLLWGVALLLGLFGIAFIYSAGYVGAEHVVRLNWIRQTVWLIAGCVLGGFLSFWDKRRLSWRLFVAGGYVFWLVCLVVVLVMGRRIGGAQRWLALGPVLIQPAEFARLFTILAICQVLGTGTHRPFWRQVLNVLCLVFPPFALIFIEPSVGNACSLLPITAVLLLIHSGRSKLCTVLCHTFLIVLTTVLLALFWCRSQGVTLQKIGGEDSILSTVFRPYHLKRINAFLSPRGDWNERQSLMTVASGGVYGQGYLNGTLKRLGYLPRTVAPTDFIFAVIAEEGGLLFGSLPVLLAYAALIWLILHRAVHAANDRDMYLCAAVATLIAVHVMIGVGMAIRLVPIIGMPLPLLSYGGSFTMTMMMAIGLVDGTGQVAGGTLNCQQSFFFHIPHILTISFKSGEASEQQQGAKENG